MRLFARVMSVALNVTLLMAPFCLARITSAQKPAASDEVKQEVPDNPVEHAPPEQADSLQP